MKKSALIIGLVLGVLVIVAQTPAYAVTFGFSNITNNLAGDAAIGEAQLFMDVDEILATQQILFTFRNIGPEASSITDIYFDDDVPLIIYQSFQYPTTGVNFTPTTLLKKFLI